MATRESVAELLRQARNQVQSEILPASDLTIPDLAQDAAISVIIEGGFDDTDSDLILGAEMSDLVQTALEIAFMLQPQLATRQLDLPDYGTEES
jgi:hypothetical protein